MDLPAGTVTRLTADPHADAFPRISPDGRPGWPSPAPRRRGSPSATRCRGTPGRSTSRRAAPRRHRPRGANGPFWSRDGRTIFFQRNGGEFVAHRLDTGAERVPFRAGVPPVPAGAVIGNPDYDEATGRLVATLRGAGVPRITALLTPAGPLQKLGGRRGLPDRLVAGRGFLYFVGHGGRQENALFRMVAGDRPELSLDLPAS